MITEKNVLSFFAALAKLGSKIAEFERKSRMMAQPSFDELLNKLPNLLTKAFGIGLLVFLLLLVVGPVVWLSLLSYVR